MSEHPKTIMIKTIIIQAEAIGSLRALVQILLAEMQPINDDILRLKNEIFEKIDR